jgi:hypothetical protein
MTYHVCTSRLKNCSEQVTASKETGIPMEKELAADRNVDGCSSQQ